MFGGRLPRIPIQLSDAAGFMGKCVYQQRRLPNGLTEHHGYILRISTRMDLPENVVEDIIIHEMIHYFILWAGLHDTSSHGHIFRAIMESINAAHGRHITISYRPSSEEARQEVSGKRTWHVIAAIYFRDGRTGVKVLPRTIPKVLDYHRAAAAHPGVVEVRLYLHDNPFFNRFPTSAALRIHNIDRALLEENLQKARPLKIVGTRLIEAR